MKKIAAFLFLSILTTLSLRADVLFQDSTNYPYTDGCIEGQGQWYCFYPANTTNLDALVANNVLLLNSTNHDEVAAPTNGWVNNLNPYFNFASFQINVSQLPSTANGGYFCQFQDKFGTNHCCHVFIDTHDTVVPGTFRLGLANYATSFAALVPPVNYPLDLATGVTYTVVIAFDNTPNATIDTDPLLGSTLWINPSETDYQNAINGYYSGTAGIGVGYVYGLDTTANTNLLQMIESEIGFSPYVNAGISNVIVATTFDQVNTTNLPVFGVQPQSQTNYSGNSTIFYSAASGVDLTYHWFSTISGMLSDNGNIVGSTSNILIINNLSASDKYYVVATDFYNNSATSATATNTVITDPTAVFFPPSVTPANLTNYLFVTTGFTNTALGTGPIAYQWYFAPTNTPNTYTQLVGQTSAALNFFLGDYTYQGNYYVVASNSISGGSIAFGPTNSLTELAPLIASLPQLHAYLIATTNQYIANKSSTYYITTNNLQVSGYVTTYGGFGSTYSTFMIQDATGFGVEVYAGTSTPGWTGPACNTNTPPIGSYVTVSAPLEVYNSGLELTPLSVAAITINSNVPPIVLSPKLANANFNDYATNGVGTNALNALCSLVTFTNVYIYGNRTGGAIGNGGNFYSNSYSSGLYFTVGNPYHAPDNTNTIQIYQYAYNYGTTNNSFGTTINPIGGQHVPTNCYQLTGAYFSFKGSPEIFPSRLVDYVTNAPVPFPVTVALTNNGRPVLNWTNSPGSTYSVYSSTNLHGLWTQEAFGYGYYPTNCTFADTNKASAKFYRISTP